MAWCINRRAMSISRTAPCAQGITSVVSTARTPTSSQMATSSAFTPVVSAAVSLREALGRGHEAEADRLDDRVDEIGHAPPLQGGDRRLEGLEPRPEVGDRHDASLRARELAGRVEVRAVHAEDELGAGCHGGADLSGVE